MGHPREPDAPNVSDGCVPRGDNFRGAGCAERALATSNALVFEADATRQLYAAWAGADRSIVVRYGVDTGVINAFCRRVSHRESQSRDRDPARLPVILVMGTIEPRKAQTRIAQAFALARKQHPDWMLVFVGDSDTYYSDGLKEYLRNAGLKDRTRVVPVVEDIYPWYRAADLLLSLSDMESLPRSALEAMCFGLPVLSTSVFGLPELLEDGRTGFLFRTERPQCDDGRVGSRTGARRSRAGRRRRGRSVSRCSSITTQADMLQTS